MKLNDKKELRGKTTEELAKLLKESYNTLAQLRLDNVQNKLKNTRSMTNTRKEVAIMKTLLNERSKTEEGVTEVKDQKSNLKKTDKK